MKLHRRSFNARLLVLCSGSMLLAGRAHAGAYEDFFRAIELDDAARLRELLARGMDPNTLDPKGQHGLFLALRGGAAKAVQALLEPADTRIDSANAAGETPLMMAALRADVDAMRALMARGAAVNRPGWTPLHYAASSPSAAPVKLLLEQGAAVDARSPNGNTPLMLAARYGSEDSVALLLAKGADRKLRNDRNQTAADTARLDGRESLARRLETGNP
ncbi:MAG: ankyrin repeat domain-containing protein [Proteobacteria bacterium]|nr:ankyrin repeat domain-containing protein [Pseudomonadota bacterium]